MEGEEQEEVGRGRRRKEGGGRGHKRVYYSVTLSTEQIILERLSL